jgi:peptide/nickel transport system permease protein
MQRYILRRLVQAFFTVFGVMLITFVLFRVIAGDVSAAYVNQKLGTEAKRTFYEKHKLDRPAVFNIHRTIEIVDVSKGTHITRMRDVGGSQLVKLLGIHVSPWSAKSDEVKSTQTRLVGNLFARLNEESMLTGLVKGKPLVLPPVDHPGTLQPPDSPAVEISLNDGTVFLVGITGITTMGNLMTAINTAPENNGKVTAILSKWSWYTLFDSQFFWHIKENITFSGRSYATDQSIFEIIIERARFSLALTVPALAIEWLLSMIIASFVAYYRNTWIDKLGVFLSVLGMCVPYLAYMLIGQWIMFQLAPDLAVGLSHPLSIYIPIGISVVAGMGGMVRFYRTIILDEINRDYVRTARAKGVPLPTILFVHVLKNCMLPILTNLISTIPFLILGSLLLERFFGLPGLGDLMLTSITSRDVPIITGLTFLTSLLYVLSLLLTDVLYAVFDPRIRLR